MRLNLSDIEVIILENDKKLISKLYKKLLEWYLADKQIKQYMTVNFNRILEMQSREYLWQNSNKISPCYQVKEYVFKIHTRWYMTPRKLNRMDPNLSKICW